MNQPRPAGALWRRLLALCLALVLLTGALAGCGGGEDTSSSAAPSSSGAAGGGTDSSGDASGSGTDGDAAPAPRAGEENSLYVPDFAVQAEAAILVNEDTGLVIYEKNADTPLVSASLVKMMTCILAMDFVERYDRDLDTEMVDSTDKTWVYDELYGKNASTADIRKGETLSMRELLYACLLPSANEGALLLADHVAGGYMVNFLYMMNTRAAALGCTGTYFADPNGLSEENVTTARDMALITRAFMSYPVLVEIAGTASYEMAQHEKHTGPYNIHTTNRLLVRSSPYYSAAPKAAGTVVAGKTGSLGEWQNFASYATKNGESYICVVMHSPDVADTVGAAIDPPQKRPALVESAQLYAWAFTGYTVRGALDTTQPVTELRVRYSTEQDTVKLLPLGDIKAVLPLGAGEELLKYTYDLPEYVAAPVAEGQVLGTVTLTVGGRAVGTAQLVAMRSIARNDTLYMMNRTGAFFSSPFFKALVALVVLAVAAYIALVVRAARRKAGGQPPGAAKRPPPKAPAGKRPPAKGPPAKPPPK